jgi:hypothetical protein
MFGGRDGGRGSELMDACVLCLGSVCFACALCVCVCVCVCVQVCKRVSPVPILRIYHGDKWVE